MMVRVCPPERRVPLGDVRAPSSLAQVKGWVDRNIIHEAIIVRRRRWDECSLGGCLGDQGTCENGAVASCLIISLQSAACKDLLR